MRITPISRFSCLLLLSALALVALSSVSHLRTFVAISHHEPQRHSIRMLVCEVTVRSGRCQRGFLCHQITFLSLFLLSPEEIGSLNIEVYMGLVGGFSID